MFYLIIALVLIATVAAYKQLTTEERKVVAKGAFDATRATATYLAKGAKEVVVSTYDLGTIAGAEVSLHQQESLNTVDKFSKDLEARGGAIKVAIKTAKDHGETTGLSDIGKSIKDKKAAVLAELEAARALRGK